MNFVETTYREKREEREVLRNYQHDKGKGVWKDSYQAGEIVMEIEEWKQKVADDYARSFGRVLLGVFKTSIRS